jgi:hypothetical protein
MPPYANIGTRKARPLTRTSGLGEVANPAIYLLSLGRVATGTDVVGRRVERGEQPSSLALLATLPQAARVSCFVKRNPKPDVLSRVAAH